MVKVMVILVKVIVGGSNFVFLVMSMQVMVNGPGRNCIGQDDGCA